MLGAGALLLSSILSRNGTSGAPVLSPEPEKPTYQGLTSNEITQQWIAFSDPIRQELTRLAGMIQSGGYRGGALEQLEATYAQGEAYLQQAGAPYSQAIIGLREQEAQERQDWYAANRARHAANRIATYGYDPLG
jgi:hypothetical protein